MLIGIIVHGLNFSWEIIPEVNKNWGAGVLFKTYSDDVGAKLYFKVKPPITENYTLNLSTDDGFKLYLDRTLVLNGVYPNTETFSIFLDSDNYYDFYGEYDEETLDAYFRLAWEYPSQPEQVIPSQYLYYPDFVSPPIERTISCNLGFTRVISLGRPKCVTICGDGIEAGLEK